METGSLDMSASTTRPSRLIAEALVLKHDSTVVEQRAHAMGLSERLTKAVVRVCCRETATGQKTNDLASEN